MARIRTIKPSFWGDQDVASLRKEARLMLIGMISFADDEGYFLASATALGGYIFPHDEMPPTTIRKWRDEIAKAGIIEVYKVDGLEYGHFPNWERHQRISHPTASVIPKGLTG